MAKKFKIQTDKALSGKVALVTGANQGIGLAIARALAANGCNLVITGRDKRRLKQALKTLKKAGIAHPGRKVDKLQYETWKQVIDTNLNGLFLVTHTMLPLIRRGGAIANNLSIAAKRVFPGSSAYNASKHGALGFTNTLREELRGKGIRVIAMLPGATDTAIWETLWPEAPRKKMMSAETVATV